MVFFNGIRFVIYFALLFLVYSVYSKDSYVRCEFMSDRKVQCSDCKALHLVQCGKLIGFVSGNTRTRIVERGSRYSESFSLDKAFMRGQSFNEDRYMKIIKKTPMYRTPLGKNVVAGVGDNNSGEIDHTLSICRYDKPSIPNTVYTSFSGLEWKVCYGHVICDVDLEGFGLAESARTEMVPVACTAKLQGKCPTARECMEDPTVAFSEVASKKDKEESQLREEVMTAIREAADEFKGESWDKIQERIDEEIKIHTARQRAVEAWMVAQQEERERYKTVQESQRESTRKRQRARHGGR